MGEGTQMCAICTCGFTTIFLFILLLVLFSDPKHPNLSIEEFSVPAFNKTSNQTTGGDIYFDLKLRNMNKAIGLYYDEPFSLAFSYYPLEEPYQKYVWVYTQPPFYQGNGKTKHITTLLGLPPSTVVNEQDDDSKENMTAVVSFRINLIFKCRYKFASHPTHDIEVGADVMVYANTGDRVSGGSIKLV